MESRWRKAKMSLGLNLCVYVPRTLDDDGGPPSTGSSTAALVSPAASSSSAATSANTTPTADTGGGASARGPAGALMPTTPTPTSAGLRLSKSGSKSFKKTCAICLTIMKPGQGHALFTAECSHTFHFHCIAANVKHGSNNCPVCRTEWKELPFRGPLVSEIPQGSARISPVNGHQNGGHMTLLRPLPRARSSGRLHHVTCLLPDTDRSIFNDDEPLDLSEATEGHQQGCSRTVEIETYPEFTEIPESTSERNFTVLIHLKAPIAQNTLKPGSLGGDNGPNTGRAPVDLITVLDVSGSMAGTKLALLKRAMGFVIQNLGSSDRLSVIAFSSSARRLFPLRRMTESGRQQSLLAVNSLTSNGGTNIAEGLRKGSKVIEERQAKNPVCSIILLSDGQDTYTVSPTSSAHKVYAGSPAAGAQKAYAGSPTAGAQKVAAEYCALLPSTNGSQQAPVHVFGFGADHDAASLHSISQTSGGTFSFIETEATIQDAFAQCIGGLLSVVAQDLRVKVESLHPDVHFGSIRSGSYSSRITDDKRNGSIDVGDLYAEEERDFLMSVSVPQGCGDETTLLKVGCVYKDPLMKETINMAEVQVKISRPAFVSVQTVSIQVDRQKNRLHAAEVMAAARFSAERGDLTHAVSLLEDCRRMIMASASGQSGDRLCQSLDAELKEMQERMANRQRYEASGRAYVLSGLSSHSWQRATARGDSTDSESLIQAYQTTSMVDMVLRSQTQTRSSTPRQTPQMRHAKSFPARPQPR